MRSQFINALNLAILGFFVLVAQEAFAQCGSDVDCDDGVFCNGVETCVGSSCVEGSPPCVDSSIPDCDEAARECVVCLPGGPSDTDGDGFCSPGADCDDTNPFINPGATELCVPGESSANVDEDCDPSTVGAKDEDRDGFVDAACCNTGGGGLICGEDCNDDNRSIVPGAMVCNSDDSGVLVCTDTGLFEESPCPRLTGCVTQPNGTGLCAFKPGRLDR